MLGWIGNVFIVLGLFGVANRWRKAFLASMVGESAWIMNAYLKHDMALMSICTIFFVMAVYGFIKWGEPKTFLPEAAAQQDRAFLDQLDKLGIVNNWGKDAV